MSEPTLERMRNRNHNASFNAHRLSLSSNRALPLAFVLTALSHSVITAAPRPRFAIELVDMIWYPFSRNLRAISTIQASTNARFGPTTRGIVAGTLLKVRRSCLRFGMGPSHGDSDSDKKSEEVELHGGVLELHQYQ
jgi:hypothetical protein